MERKIHIFTAAFILSLFSITVYAQDNSNARSLGMAFGSITSSYGVDAYGINPANFDYHKLSLTKKTNNNKPLRTKDKLKQSFEISLLSFGGGYGSDNSFGFYHNYTNYLTENYRNLINIFTDINTTLDFKANVLGDKESNVDFDFELKWFSINYLNPLAGAFNVTVSDKVGLTSIVGSKEEFLNFQTSPNPGSTSYNINNFRLIQQEAAAWWIRKYTAGYAKQFDLDPKGVIKSISIGFSGAFVHGFGNVSMSRLSLTGDSWGVQNINGVNHVDSVTGGSEHHIQTSSTDFFRGYNDAMRSKFSFFPKPAGKGYSFDFGIGMQITDYVKVAASVSELGKIRWDYNTFVSRDNNSFSYYDFYVADDDPTYQALLNDIKGADSRDSNIVYETSLPTKYRAGISVQPTEKLLIEFNFLSKKSMLPNKPYENLYSLAGEFSPVSFLPLRAGLSLGGPGEFNIALGGGIKLSHFVMDIGVYGVNQLLTGKRFLAAFSTKLVF